MNIIILIIVLLASFSINAQQVEMGIIQDTSMINHYPGVDGLIGNVDDIISANLSTNNGSAPNNLGSISYNAFNFGGATGEATMPTGFNAITFVDGNVTVDQMIFTNGGGPIISGLNITSGTEPFVGHGAYTSMFTAVNSGTYNSTTYAFTLNVDVSYLINGNVSTEPGLVLTGTAILLHDDQYVAGSGNLYVDSILVPLAQTANASSLVYFDGTGTIPNLGFPIRSVVVAFESANDDVIFQNGFE